MRTRIALTLRASGPPASLPVPCAPSALRRPLNSNVRPQPKIMLLRYISTSAVVLATIAGCATQPPPTCSNLDKGKWIVSWAKEFHSKAPYPSKARAERREGQVELQIYVSRSGTLTHVEVAKSSGQLDLDAAAIDGIRKVQFSPPVCNGQQTDLAVTLPVAYELGEE